MIVSYNFYYARPGNAAAVLQQRIRASDVRAGLGLPRGRIISRLEGDGDWPDVVWRHDFTDMATQDADMQARADSPEFEAIRQGMRQLYRRFERPLYLPAPGNDAENAVPTTQTLVLHGLYCETGTAVQAQEILRDAGLRSSVRLITEQQNIPQLLVETADGSLPPALLQLPLRLERSLWRIEDPRS